MRIGERGRFRYLAVRLEQWLQHRFQRFGFSGTQGPPRLAARRLLRLVWAPVPLAVILSEAKNLSVVLRMAMTVRQRDSSLRSE